VENLVNIVSWRLFETESYVTGNSAIDTFIKSVRDIQKSEESPRGSNKGPTINPLLKNVSSYPGEPWCAAFVYNVFTNSGFSESFRADVKKTAAVKNLWALTPKSLKYSISDDKNFIPLPGMVFCYKVKSKEGTYPGPGHTGIILSVDSKKREWTGIEGNTNPLDGSREGYGCYLVTRKMSDPCTSKNPGDHPALLLGYIDYFRTYRSTPQSNKTISAFNSYMNKKCSELITELSPKTKNEISYLNKNPKVLKDYETNYKNRNKA
jgi:hypothetical protein